MEAILKNPALNQLLEDVTTPTETKPAQVAFLSVAEAPKSETEPEATTPTTPAAQPAQVAPVEPITDEAIELGADIAIGSLDFAQNNIFKFFLNRKKKARIMRKFGEDGLDQLENLINEIEAGKSPKELTPDQLGLLRLEKNVKEILDELPLSEDDRKALKQPLMVIMKKRGGTLPPEYALLLAVLQIFGGRTAEIYML